MVENSPTITKDESRKSDQLWCGNKSTINIANNSIQHDRTKHIEIDRFFIKEKLDSEILKLMSMFLLNITEKIVSQRDLG